MDSETKWRVWWTGSSPEEGRKDGSCQGPIELEELPLFALQTRDKACVTQVEALAYLDALGDGAVAAAGDR